MLLQCLYYFQVNAVKDRVTMVREPSGALRTATVEENDRMVRMFFESKYRPVIEPTIFEANTLRSRLAEGKHIYVLDYACHYFLPDNPRYIEVYSG